MTQSQQQQVQSLRDTCFGLAPIWGLWTGVRASPCKRSKRGKFTAAFVAVWNWHLKVRHLEVYSSRFSWIVPLWRLTHRDFLLTKFNFLVFRFSLATTIETTLSSTTSRSQSAPGISASSRSRGTSTTFASARSCTREAAAAEPARGYWSTWTLIRKTRPGPESERTSVARSQARAVTWPGWITAVRSYWTAARWRWVLRYGMEVACEASALGR